MTYCASPWQHSPVESMLHCLRMCFILSYWLSDTSPVALYSLTMDELDQPMPKQPRALVQQETITQILMFGLERGSILTSWLKLTRYVISMDHLELREALVTAFLKRNKKIRDSFRPVVQNLCTNYLSGVDQIMYADVPYMAPCDEEEPLGALGKTVEL